jgi:hypothetical protein
MRLILRRFTSSSLAAAAGEIKLIYVYTCIIVRGNAWGAAFSTGTPIE